jgi:hypothetical protein
LKELDFREKGGYARDVIDVVLFEDDRGVESAGSAPLAQTGHEKVVQALLYRGTLDNPALWARALNDLALAAGKEPWFPGCFRDVEPVVGIWHRGCRCLLTFSILGLSFFL